LPPPLRRHHGFPQGDDLVQGTNPYYRTAYALVAKQGGGLDDVATLKTGVSRQTYRHRCRHAAATNMAVNGLMANAKPYPLMIDTRIDSSAAAMIKDLTSGRSTPPFCGAAGRLLCKQANRRSTSRRSSRKRPDRTRLSHRHGRSTGRPELETAAQPPDPGEPAAINKILLDFGVPLLDDNDRPITVESATKQP